MRNDPVRDALAQFNAKPDDAARIDFYRHLADGLLLVAVDQVPDGIDVNGTVLQEDTPLSVLTTPMPDGGTALLAFTDVDSLRARIPDTPYVGMHSRDLLEVVIDRGYDALIINAAGPWAGIPREDILRILEGVWFEQRGQGLTSSLCNLGVLCDSVVISPRKRLTTETQRTPRGHREIKLRHHPTVDCLRQQAQLQAA